MPRKYISLFLFTVFILFTSLSYAETTDSSERILFFDSSININLDASIDVTEIITVYANQDKIRHGLMRQLPINNADSTGNSHHTNYHIQRILNNDVQSPYHTDYNQNDIDIYVGNSSTLLAPGIYSYTIQYHVDNAVNFLKNTDELYWNITGNNWDFVIAKVQADITLPENLNISHYASYSGKTGDKRTNFIASQPRGNQISFVSTQPLIPHEGLTVAISWPKGVITEPNVKDKIFSSLQFKDTAQYIQLIIALLVLAYFIFVWHWYGKDPLPGVIIPIFEPPMNLSPASVRYISNMGFDDKTYSAAIISMATKKFIKINNDDNKFTLEKISSDTDMLSTEEKVIADILFTSTDTTKKNPSSISVTTNNWSYFQNANSALKKSLSKQYLHIDFNLNTIFIIPALLLTLLAFTCAISSSSDPVNTMHFTFLLAVCSVISYLFLIFAIKNIRQMIHQPSSSNIFNSIVFSLLFFFIFLSYETGLFVELTFFIPIITIVLLFFTCILNVVFYYLLQAPTIQGRKIDDQIEGFKLYLATTERDRLNQLNPPNSSPEIFEKYMPYAIALDVENAWGEHFNTILKSAGSDPATYQPVWYTGTRWSSGTFTTFPAQLNNSLSSALSSASTSPSSGGFSGGGGGW